MHRSTLSALIPSNRLLLALGVLTTLSNSPVKAEPGPAQKPPSPANAAPPASPAPATVPKQEKRTPTVISAEALEAAGKLPADPAAWMARFIAGLGTDTDHQAAHALKLIQVLIETDRWREAGPVVEMIADYRKPVALYHLAVEAAQAGKREESDRFHAAAEKQPAAVLDFERDEILAARVIALGARGDLEKARKELAGIRQPDLRSDSQGRLYEFVPAEQATVQANEFLTAQKVSPSTKGRALLLAATTLEKAGRTEEAKALTITGIETLCKAADVDTIPLLHQAVLLLVKLEEKAAAARWAKVCLGFAERTDVRAHWKARDMRLSAECLQVSGCEKEAADALKSIPNMISKLDPMSYSKGGMEAASAFLLAKKPELFHQAAAHVLDLTRGHPHHRARAMAAVDVLVAYLREKQELPPAVRFHLGQSAEAVEKDLQFLNPV